MQCHATQHKAIQSMQHHAMSHHVMQCLTSQRHATQCNVMPRHTTPYHTMQRHVMQSSMPCQVMQRPTTLCNVMSRHTIQHIAMPPSYHSSQPLSKYAKLQPELAHDRKTHTPSDHSNQQPQNMPLCTQNCHLIVTTIHHPTIVTNQLRNMSHCRLNRDMIVTTIYHPTIVTQHSHTIVTHYALAP